MFLTGKMAFDGHDTRQILALNPSYLKLNGWHHALLGGYGKSYNACFHSGVLVIITPSPHSKMDPLKYAMS